MASLMNSESPSPSIASHSQAKKHAVITIEPLLDDKLTSTDQSKKSGKLFSNSPSSLAPPPAGPSAELQRQQRRRLIIHFLGWVLMAVMIILAGVLVYFLITSHQSKN